MADGTTSGHCAFGGPARVRVSQARRQYCFIQHSVAETADGNRRGLRIYSVGGCNLRKVGAAAAQRLSKGGRAGPVRVIGGVSSPARLDDFVAFAEGSASGLNASGSEHFQELRLRDSEEEEKKPGLVLSGSNLSSSPPSGG